MALRARRRRSYREAVNCELELRPLMNVFIVLIPMLLMSAVFMEIRVIDMHLPSSGAVASAAAEPFDLAVRILPDRYSVEANGNVLTTIPRQPAAKDGSVPGDTMAGLLQLALADIVAAHPGHREVRIVAGATTKYEEIVSVMDAARAAGLPEAGLEAAGEGGI